MIAARRIAKELTETQKITVGRFIISHMEYQRILRYRRIHTATQIHTVPELHRKRLISEVSLRSRIQQILARRILNTQFDRLRCVRPHHSYRHPVIASSASEQAQNQSGSIVQPHHPIQSFLFHPTKIYFCKNKNKFTPATAHTIYLFEQKSIPRKYLYFNL